MNTIDAAGKVAAGEHFLVGNGERGRTGILLIHRLGGMPSELHELARGLNRHGYTVLAVKLAGHCGSLQELAGAGWMDWLDSVRSGADVLASRVDRMVVGGVSTGAVLALALAQERPFHVAGVLALSPVFGHDGRTAPQRVRAALRLLIARALGIDRHRVLQGRLRAAGLPGIPWWPLAEMRKLAASVSRRMDMLRAPCLVIHARHDDVAPVSNAFKIVQGARNTNVQLQLLTDRRHVVTMGRGCGDVVSRVAAFVDGTVRPGKVGVD
ncbi:alpha/beta hydrolase [Achromobacter spanius]|uniref:alpha/beta hydrolase n=1 Tax=Achromobacter spanius TaxID=217203 RepID=UPI00381382B6